MAGGGNIKVVVRCRPFNSRGTLARAPIRGLSTDRGGINRKGPKREMHCADEGHANCPYSSARRRKDR